MTCSLLNWRLLVALNLQQVPNPKIPINSLGDVSQRGIVFSDRSPMPMLSTMVRNGRDRKEWQSSVLRWPWQRFVGLMNVIPHSRLNASYLHLIDKNDMKRHVKDPAFYDRRATIDVTCDGG